MRLDSFKVLMCLYLLAGCFTHFSLVPSSPEEELRRIGAVISLREACFFALFLYSILHFLMRALGRIEAYRQALPVFVLSVLYAIFLVVAQSGDKGLFQLVIVFRVVIMVLATLVIPVEVALRPDRADFIRNMVAVLLLFEAVVVLVQLAQMPPYYGATFLGPRAVGSFASALHLSFFGGVAAILLAVRPGQFRAPLLAVAAFICLASGGRAGMILLVIALLYRLFASLRRSRVNMILFAGLAVTLVFMAYLFVSMPALSGREGTVGGLESEARWTTWAVALQRNFSDAGIAQWLFGVGVGTGSNTAASLAMGWRNISDSTPIFMLQSFGLAGLVIFTATALVLWRRVARLHMAALLGWFLVANTQILVELHPMNLLLLSCMVPMLPRRHRVPVAGPPGQEAGQGMQEAAGARA